MVPRIEKPHYIDGEDCQGVRETYWRCFAFDSLGKCLMGIGQTELDAKRIVEERLEERERFLASSARERLKSIAEKEKFYEDDIDQAIRTIAEIILDNK
jgi:hypothetical protein